MPYYKQLGQLPPKRHTELARSPGFLGEGVAYEEVISTEGFDRAYSIAYHLRPPTRVRAIEAAGGVAPEFVDESVLRHHHLKTREIDRKGDPITGRVVLLANADVAISRCRPAQPQGELYRNGAADEIIFIQHGQGTLHTHFGALAFRALDYVVIPRCTTYRIDFDPAEGQVDLLVVESAGLVRIPGRYLNPDGQIKLGAPYSERDFRGPAHLDAIDREEDTPVLVKHGDRLTRYVLAHHPFDVVGWDGFVYPHAFSAGDFEPITGTVHQPPPIHQTFDSSGFVLCTFAPRPLDSHPKAVKVPYAHSNVGSDEVLYYVRGNFGSRRGIEESSITLHPAGIPHGPHPGTFVASRSATRTDELAVMIDTERPLRLTRAALSLDDPSYPSSWME